MSLRAALQEQARACRSLGSPFTARVLDLIAQRWGRGTPLADRLFDWPGTLGPSGASLPLRLAGGLHWLARNCDEGLAAAYPPASAGDGALWAAMAQAFDSHAAWLDDWMGSAPQTNEVGRSAALIAAAHWVTARTGARQITLSELGASAGLNLWFDRYALETGSASLGPADAILRLVPEVRGAPLPARGDFEVADRRGCDLNPIDPSAPGDADRLLAYIWADQDERLARTRSALAAAQPVVEQADAAAWLARRLARPWTGLHLVFHTIAWQYFPDATQADGRSSIEAAGQRATADAPLAWLRYEADGQRPGAGLSVVTWPGGEETVLGRVDFHGRWIDWRAPDSKGQHP